MSKKITGLAIQLGNRKWRFSEDAGAPMATEQRATLVISGDRVYTESEVKAMMEPKWIPVSDRLPEAGVVVMVEVEYLEFSSSENPGLVNKRTIDLGEFVDGSGGGRIETFAGPHGETPDNITHWMPLPEPPNT